MAWNYRNYGRSEGTANPYASYHDSEAILKFVKEDLGIQGKIGCFGRSLGGTMATHLACNYPQDIEFLFIDRSLGSLGSMSESSFLGTKTQLIYKMFSRHWIVNSGVNF
jgi:pimeloyl-ACP methyl ester carboxylesterase